MGAATGRGSAPPGIAPGLVRRTALLDRLAGTGDRPLVLVVAPPGYGKTTALAQWVRDDGRDGVWLTVEDADNDPGRIIGRLAAALGAVGAVTEEVQRTRNPTVRHLLDELRVRRAPVVVVLDDVHHLRPAPVPDLLVELAVGLPEGSQLVLAGRSAALRIGRLRAEQRCTELGPAELAFDLPEAAEAVALAGADLDAAALRRLVGRTEGWPAGVYLGALARRYRVELDGDPGRVSGDDAFITDYFRDELLSRLPPDTVDFLLRTSVLDRLTAPLCDAVLGTGDAAARLADIEQRNLFLVPLDHARRWYRYHRLFAEALRAELHRRDPGAEQRAHRRAAAWFAAHDDPERAVDHWIAGGDPAAAARLVDELGADLIAVGRIATVRRWIDVLGPGALLTYPPALVTAAWAAALSGESERALQLLGTAESARFDGPPLDGHASLDAAIALLRAMMGVDGVDRMLADARRAHAADQHGNPWNALATTVLGIALVLTGDRDAALPHLEHAALLGREHPRVESALALAVLSLLAAERRDAAAAVGHAAEARKNLVAAGMEHGTTAVATYLAHAAAAVLAGDRETASRGLGAAVRQYLAVPPAAFPWLATLSALVLGRVALALDDALAARIRLDDARRHLARLPVPGVLSGAVDELGEAVALAARPALPSAMALSAAEERVLRLLPTHLTLTEIGEALHVSRNTVKSHVSAIHRKLGCSTRAEAVRRARELGLLV